MCVYVQTTMEIYVYIQMYTCMYISKKLWNICLNPYKHMYKFILTSFVEVKH